MSKTHKLPDPNGQVEDPRQSRRAAWDKKKRKGRGKDERGQRVERLNEDGRRR